MLVPVVAGLFIGAVWLPARWSWRWCSWRCGSLANGKGQGKFDYGYEYDVDGCDAEAQHV